MSFFVQSTPPLPAKTKDAKRVARAVAVIFILMAALQFATFMNFVDIVAGFKLPGDEIAGAIVSTLIIASELTAIPFLLRFRLSPAMRAISMAFGWIVTVGWLFVLVWQNLVRVGLDNSGLFGATLAVPAGWHLVFLMLAVGILVVWASWGMWPIRRRSTSAR